ncbi:MAG: class I tRNA ligase family protein, partial [Pseudomonadota bacterium]
MQQREYKDTVTLPKTSFAMRAGLPQKEVNFLKKWEEENLWQALRHKSRNAKRYIIHDGPPYANGHLHIGHALNKILKDLINRSYQMMGYDAHYVPGWDCHGLPIEWKIEEQLRAKGKNKDDLPINSFRKLCRNFAQKWIDIQINEFKRLGVSANWDHPYKTMDFESEALIVKEIGKFLLNGSLYLGKKPVFWSIVERTALAEAEIEYKDHVSVSVDIGFEIVESVQSDLIGAHVVIWTTTPWTLPANRAIAFNDKFSYGLYHINGFLEGSQSAVSPNVRIIIADRLWPDFIRKCRLDENQCKRLGDIDAQILSRTICAHPWADHGYDHKIHCYHGDFVSDQTGTGFVHIAPTHGHEDYELSLKYGFTGFDTVGEDGVFMDHVPIFAGTSVYDFEGKKGTAEKPIIEMLKKVKKLYAIEKIKHSYPHSWRSKAPLIFRNTSQWFISMSENNLREKALKAIDDTVFFPPPGQKRLYDMIEQRPDWCLSRQRFWGVPIAIFKHVKTGQPLRDSKIMENIEKAFAEHGSDIWYDADPRQFLTPEYNKDEWSPVYDVADVWFDSGSTHAFVLEQRKELKW